MKIKVLVTHQHTEPDMYGNVYHATTIQATRTGKSFTAYMPCLGNVEYTLLEAFQARTLSDAGIWTISRSTGSKRASSLPEETARGLNPCAFADSKAYPLSWKKELNKIGLRLPRRGQA